MYYAFRRSGIEIPFPMRTVIMKDGAAREPRTVAALELALGRVSISRASPEAQRRRSRRPRIAACTPPAKSIVRRGRAGCSMFVLLSGEAAVLIERQRT